MISKYKTKVNTFPEKFVHINYNNYKEFNFSANKKTERSRLSSKSFCFYGGANQI